MTYSAGESTTCPHYKTWAHLQPVILNDSGGFREAKIKARVDQSMVALVLLISCCPACAKPIVVAQQEGPPNSAGRQLVHTLLWPDSTNRPVPADVETASQILAADFREVVTVYPKSKKASAALSRRCLQFVLTDRGGAKKKDLAAQIEEVLPSLPSELALNVDAIRQVGNFAAHPIKSKSSGEIVEVEDGEAEWLLDVLEELFEYYYVAPAQAAQRRATLNAKLAEIGKPPLKTP